MDYQMNLLLQMMQAMRQDGEAQGGSGGKPGLPPFTMLETFLPYLPPQSQKSVGTMLQLWELEKTLTEYTEHIANHSAQQDGDWRYELLNSLRPHLPPRKQLMADVLIRMIEINELLEEMEQHSDYE